MQSFAIIPAAGNSVRMQQDKLLMPWHDTTVIEHVLEAWLASRVTRVVVVVRPDNRRLAEICQATRADVVIPDSAPPEMKISVGWGLRHVERTCGPTASDAWLLAPADMPGLTAQIVDRLLAEHDAASPSILVPTVNGRRGHPVLFPWSLAAKVPQLGENEGINALTGRHSVREIAVNASYILDDLDTPADYQRMWRERRAAGPQAES